MCKELTGHEGEVSSLIVLNQEIFASGSFDGRTILWQLPSYEKTFQTEASNSSIYCLCLIDWHLMASGGKGREIKLWNIRGNKLEHLNNLEGHEEAV